MTKQQKRLAELKVVRALKYWKHADIFSLEVKNKIAKKWMKQQNLVPKKDLKQMLKRS